MTTPQRREEHILLTYFLQKLVSNFWATMLSHSIMQCQDNFQQDFEILMQRVFMSVGGSGNWLQ